MGRNEGSVLRITTAGSVDDGKSTLIGRLLYESNAILDDQLEALQSRKSRDGVLDLSLVTDGLKSEREQGITIDVAYKYFSSPKRKFILADAPGHVQYTRNMVTAASRADAAIILVDARYGILEQTRRHAYLVHLLGVSHIILAINKIDLIEYNAARITAIEADFRRLAWNSKPASLHVIPLSALTGLNISERSPLTPWYDGPSLLEVLESLEPIKALDRPAELSVQLVVRNDRGQRFASGTLSQGRLAVGQRVKILPARVSSRISELWVGGRQEAKASSGDAISIGLEDQRDLERGQLIVGLDKSDRASRSLRSKLVWFDEEPYRDDERYILKLATQSCRASIQVIRHRFDLQSLSEVEATTIVMNDIVEVILESSKTLFAEVFSDNKRAGAFILIDPRNFRTVAAGMIEEVYSLASDKTGSGRLRLVDNFTDLSGLEAGSDSVRLTQDFLHANPLEIQLKAVETFLELGWTVWVEDSPSGQQICQSMQAKGYDAFEHGLGI